MFFFRCAATIGFNVECGEYRNMIFSLWDLGGAADARNFWRLYYQDTQAIIFVVDSSDLDRMVRAAALLRLLLLHHHHHIAPPHDPPLPLLAAPPL